MLYPDIASGARVPNVMALSVSLKIPIGVWKPSSKIDEMLTPSRDNAHYIGSYIRRPKRKQLRDVKIERDSQTNSAVRNDSTQAFSFQYGSNIFLVQ
jgi:hypothetical protein